MPSKLALTSRPLLRHLHKSSFPPPLHCKSCTTTSAHHHTSVPSPHLNKISPTTSTTTPPSQPPYSPTPSLHLQPHHDLPTFRAHATRTSLSPTSTVYTGTHYEYLCASTLRRLSFALTRVGGPSDLGIDLLGQWHLPSLPAPLRVLVQCKALKSSARPESIRELQGAIVGAPAAWRMDAGAVVGVLCAKTKATMGVRRAVQRCGMPVVWVMVEDLGERGGRVRQVLWNERVDELGGQGVGVGVRYLGGGVEREMVLMWKGEMWEPELVREEGMG